jgi:outer membrane lipoprotein SlyB
MNTKLILCLPLAAIFCSCAQDSMSGDTYSPYEARQAQNVSTGRIIALRGVKIEGGNQMGTIVGGLAGGILGSQLGGGRTANTAGALGGALVGSAVGSRAQQGMGSRNGVEITVRLDQGGTTAIVQEVSKNERFNVGDRVRILSNGGRTRVAF